MDLEAQLGQLMAWWPGEYDNNEQIVRQSGGGLAKPVYEPIPRLYSQALVLNQPKIGERVIYIEQHLNNDPGRARQARVYALAVDEQAQAIRALPYVFRDGSQPVPAGGDAAAGIVADDLRALPAGCAVLIRFEGGQFRGQADAATCPEDDWVSREFVVGPKRYWIRSGLETRGRDFAYIQSTRARRFVCSVAYNLEGDMTKTKLLTEIELHDQGGAADIAWPDGRTLQFIIHSREFASPSERVFPLFRIHEKGNHVPIAYAYAADNADRFGLNLGWFYILCREKGQGAPEA